MRKKKDRLIILGGSFIVVLIVAFLILFIYLISKNDIELGGYDDRLVNISYDVSDKFERSKYFYDHYHYSGDSIYCYFNIDDYSTYSYKNGNDYLRDRIMFTLNDEVSEVSEVELNGYKWYYMSVSNSGNVDYYYATVKDDKGYVINYEIRDYLNGDSASRDNFCDTEYDKIISSVRFK